MAPPLVLITSIPRLIPTTLPGRMANATVNQRFGALIVEAGGIPVAADAWGDPAPLAERVDAIVLNGGTDVDARRYGAMPEPATDVPDVRRDTFESGLLGVAVERGIPVLGVCRGMQLINVELGGTLIQDLSTATALEHYVREPYDQPVHAIDIEQDSMLGHALGRRAQVNSVHHQGLDTLGSGLRAVAHAPDETIEAIEDDSGLLLGVQWHPEFLGGDDAAAQVGLFRALVARSGAGTAMRP